MLHGDEQLQRCGWRVLGGSKWQQSCGGEQLQSCGGWVLSGSKELWWMICRE